MTIRPFDYGMIQRADDVGVIKHQEDSKTALNQSNVQNELEKHDEVILHQVNEQEDTTKDENHADAKDEGKNKYFRQDAKKKDKKEETKIVKKAPIGGGFDIKI